MNPESRQRLQNQIRQLPGFAEYQFDWEISTGSTSDDLRKSGAEGNWQRILAADYQTAGRGQFTRRWHADSGNALLFSFSGIDEGVFPLSLQLGSSVAEALREMAEFPDLWLKWPNDIFLGSGKLGGILVEGFVKGVQRNFVAGIGINFAVPSSIPGAAAIYHSEIDRADLLFRILRQFALNRHLEPKLQVERWENHAGPFFSSDFWCEEYGGNEKPSSVQPKGLNDDGSLTVLKSGARLKLHSAHLAIISPEC
ncbi:MAG: biotin--[acetyl-CoA-carboxylase] ligase [Candidatus Rifleibacteriota bacterium]